MNLKNLVARVEESQAELCYLQLLFVMETTLEATPKEVDSSLDRNLQELSLPSVKSQSHKGALLRLDSCEVF